MTPAEVIAAERLSHANGVEDGDREYTDADDPGMAVNDGEERDPDPDPRVRVAGEIALERGDHVELGAHYASTLAPEGQAVHDQGATYVYDAACGLWPALTPSAESCAVQGYAGLSYGPKRNPLRLSANDVEGSLKLARARLACPGFFDQAPPGLAFSDGFVTITGRGAELVPHSPDHRARHGYGFEFATPGQPVRFLQALGDTFSTDDDRAEKIALIQEFSGASIFGLATRYQRCIVLDGVGANGKSTLIRMVESAMPAGSVVSIPPQRWGNEYRRAAFAPALLNVVNELPESDILDGEVFKTIVTGDRIDAREIYKPPFMLQPKAGHLFAANRLPGANDTTLGFWRRFVVVTFNRKFEGSEASPTLAEDVIAAEQPAIVRWMVEGAVRVMSQGGYTIPPSSSEAVRAWRRNANPVAIFVEECTRDAKGDEPGTKAAQVYQHFRSWCDRNGHRPLSSTKFGMRMKELGKGAEKRRDANLYPVIVTGGGEA